LKKVCYKVSLCENCQRQSCMAFIGLTIHAKIIGGGRTLLPTFLQRTETSYPVNFYDHKLPRYRTPSLLTKTNCEVRLANVSSHTRVHIYSNLGWKPVISVLLCLYFTSVRPNETVYNVQFSLAVLCYRGCKWKEFGKGISPGFPGGIPSGGPGGIPSGGPGGGAFPGGIPSGGPGGGAWVITPGGSGCASGSPGCTPSPGSWDGAGISIVGCIWRPGYGSGRSCGAGCRIIGWRVRIISLRGGKCWPEGATGAGYIIGAGLCMGMGCEGLNVEWTGGTSPADSSRSVCCKHLNSLRVNISSVLLQFNISLVPNGNLYTTGMPLPWLELRLRLRLRRWSTTNVCMFIPSTET